MAIRAINRPWVRVYDPRTMDALDAGRALGNSRDSSFLFRLGRLLRAMGSKLVIGAFILMVIAVLIAAMFLFFYPTVFYPKLSPSPR